MTLSTRRVNRCRILNEGTWPNGMGGATGPMKRGRAPTYLPSPGPGGAGAPSAECKARIVRESFWPEHRPLGAGDREERLDLAPEARPQGRLADEGEQPVGT